MKRTTNVCGQVTVSGKIRLREPTRMASATATRLFPAGTVVDYIGLVGHIHVVSCTTRDGTFTAVKAESAQKPQ